MDVLSSAYAHILQNRMRRLDARMCLGTPIRPHMKPGMPLDMLSTAGPRRRPSTCSTYDALFSTVQSLHQCLYSVNTKLPPMQCLSSEQSSPKLRFAYKPLTASRLDFLVALPSCTEAKVQKRNSCHIWSHNFEKHNFCCSFIANYTVVKV